MKYPQLHPSLLAAGLCGFLPLSAPAEPSAVKTEATTETKIPFQHSVALPSQKESPSAVTGADSGGPKAFSGQSSSSARSSSSTVSVNGRTITTTRSSGPDGKDKITVTTQERSGKPKVETFTPAEYEQKYRPEKKASPAAKPAAAAPAAAAEKNNSERATE